MCCGCFAVLGCGWRPGVLYDLWTGAGRTCFSTVTTVLSRLRGSAGPVWQLRLISRSLCGCGTEPIPGLLVVGVPVDIVTWRAAYILFHTGKQRIPLTHNGTLQVPDTQGGLCGGGWAAQAGAGCGRELWLLHPFGSGAGMQVRDAQVRGGPSIFHFAQAC